MNTYLLPLGRGDTDILHWKQNQVAKANSTLNELVPCPGNGPDLQRPQNLIKEEVRERELRCQLQKVLRILDQNADIRELNSIRNLSPLERHYLHTYHAGNLRRKTIEAPVGIHNSINVVDHLHDVVQRVQGRAQLCDDTVHDGCGHRWHDVELVVESLSSFGCEIEGALGTMALSGVDSY